MCSKTFHSEAMPVNDTTHRTVLLDEAIDAALAWDDIDRAFVAVTKRAEMIFDESIATEQQSLALAKRALTNRIEQLRSKAN